MASIVDSVDGTSLRSLLSSIERHGTRACLQNAPTSFCILLRFSAMALR